MFESNIMYCVDPALYPYLKKKKIMVGWGAQGAKDDADRPA